jgi:hypothetical protein
MSVIGEGLFEKSPSPNPSSKTSERKKKTRKVQIRRNRISVKSTDVLFL